MQYGDTSEERAALERTTGLVVSRLEDIDNTNDLDGLAALMGACDAVVTVSNTTAHLAGALGAALLARFVDLGWAKRARDSRVVLLTANGERALHKMFDAHGAA